MNEFKPWHIALLVIGIGVLIGGVYYSIRSSGPSVDLVNSMKMADVVTGELYEVALTKKGVTIPMRNPSTGTDTLYPVDKDESGRWLIPLRYLGGAMASKDPKPKAIKDPKTGEITLASESPKKIDAPN